ncbi:hypothetical protein LTR62_000363 [Meristemomyces frigidus]|uniref:Uncharacterized protein n=1 Tax=Meristemomyces frigidus TaxID=1508187 RepID=A0AAN7YST9_9PEZI|nr:hypothetical protein LTR62_000363 [Meristemomyces frigidus]
MGLAKANIKVSNERFLFAILDANKPSKWEYQPVIDRCGFKDEKAIGKKAADKKRAVEQDPEDEEPPSSTRIAGVKKRAAKDGDDGKSPSNAKKHKSEEDGGVKVEAGDGGWA